MAGLVERVESQKRASHSFHQSLGNLANSRRDFHIPTAPATVTYRVGQQAKKESGSVGGGKVEIQNQDSHFPTAPTSLRQQGRQASTEDENRAVFDGPAGAGFASAHGALRAAYGSNTNCRRSGEIVVVKAKK
jgi:hypothetical protein